MLSNAFRDHVPEEELGFAVESFRATVEGTFVKGLSQRDRRRLLRFALDLLIGPDWFRPPPRSPQLGA
jgi:hypothetical protein